MGITDNIPLGKVVSYKCRYDKTLLQGIPRALNRKPLGIKEGQLPFQGEDLWNLYEISWLTPKGKPVIAVAEVRFSVNTRCLIESKSFKLYLNSFNQTAFETETEVRDLIQQDLSTVAEGRVTVSLHPESLYSIGSLDAHCIDDQDIEINTYAVQPEILQESIQSDRQVSEKLCSHLLKSNCLVTGQPDWGSVEIGYTGFKIDHKKLLQYIISFRQHNEFHEHCIERMFMDIKKYCQPEKLTIMARYTRRGGIDINPMRSDYISEVDNIRLVRQ